MSRSGYNEGDGNDWALICWRGAVASSIRGRRGQAFLLELVNALDALPAPRLIDGELVEDGEFCAIGAVGHARGMEMGEIDPYERDMVADAFGVAEALAAEVMYVNDEEFWGPGDTPEDRFARVRNWAIRHVTPETLLGGVD